MEICGHGILTGNRIGYERRLKIRVLIPIPGEDALLDAYHVDLGAIQADDSLDLSMMMIDHQGFIETVAF